MTEHATPPPQPPLLSRLPFEVEAPEKGDFADASPLSEAEQADVMRSVCWRLLPVCWFSALLSYLDRSNQSYAALQMNADLHFSTATYGLGAGIFFVGYTLLEIPSNMLLQRFGGPAWLSRIMITWGMVASCGVALHNEAGFLVLRLALGIAEAGFYPGCAYYLSTWFRDTEFGNAYAFVTLGSCSAGIVGGFLAYAFMSLDGLLTLTGWQWLFLLEGLPAIALGCAYGRLLPTSPGDAWFLTRRERAWLVDRNAAAKRSRGGAHGAAGSVAAVKAALCNWRVLYLGTIHCFGLCAYYGILFFCPLLVKEIVTAGDPPAPARRRPDVRVIALSALPYIFASAALIGNAAHSRRARETRWHAAIPLAFGSVALAVIGPLTSARQRGLALIALIVANVGAWAEHGPLATLWESAADGAEAQAAAFAVINSLGNIGGFAGTYLLGALQTDNDYSRGTLVLGVVLGLASAMVVAYKPPIRARGGSAAELNNDGGDDDNGKPAQRSVEEEALLQLGSIEL